MKLYLFSAIGIEPPGVSAIKACYGYFLARSEAEAIGLATIAFKKDYPGFCPSNVSVSEQDIAELKSKLAEHGL
jgi:hypothetical protein